MRRLPLKWLLALAMSSALLVARPGAADPPPKKTGITLSDVDGIYYRPAVYLIPYRRALEAARRPLTGCHEIALAEVPSVTAQVDALVGIAANGEVTSVSVAARGAVVESALLCFRRRLSSLSFDPPGGERLHDACCVRPR